LEKAALDWASVCSKNKLSYEIDWLGIPVIQTPEDLVLLQEVIFKVKPDFVLEVGIAHGGGMIFEASLLELLGKGKVIGIDVEIREHNRKALEAHPLIKRIEIIEGSSVDPEVVERVRGMIPAGSKTLVCLDSDHTKPHVLKELEIYQEFVAPGSYIVVFDTISSALAKRGASKQIEIDNGPGEAVTEFLKTNGNFEIDKEFNKLYSSHNQDGYLKRIK
jgi:cephalosporin hydroxylase